MVVIIRGGGATSDLNSFDSYLLAANCAQFPLPIITGIGHERDDTVVDLVAHTRMKTPTAVAEFLISRMDSVGEELESLRQDVSLLAMDILSRQKKLFTIGNDPFPFYRDKPDRAESFGTANDSESFTCDGIGLVITPPVGA